MATLSNKKNFTGLVHIKDVLRLQATDFFRLNVFCKSGNPIHHRRLNTKNIFLATTVFGSLIRNDSMYSEGFSLYDKFITYCFIYAFFLTIKPHHT